MASRAIFIVTWKPPQGPSYRYRYRKANRPYGALSFLCTRGTQPGSAVHLSSWPFFCLFSILSVDASDLPLCYSFSFFNCFKTSKRESVSLVSQPHPEIFRSAPHLGQNPLQFGEQRGFIGKFRISCSRSRSSVSIRSSL